MKIYLFLFFIFFVGIVSGIKVSPPEINFEGSAEGVICRNVTLFSDGVVIVEDRWSKEGGRKFSSYDYSSDFFGINVSYENEFFVSNYSYEEICIDSKEAGSYSGVLLFRIKDSNEGVGVWLDVNISEGDSVYQKITGLSINEYEGKFNVVFLIVTFVLLLVLLGLVIFMKRKKM